MGRLMVAAGCWSAGCWPAGCCRSERATDWRAGRRAASLWAAAPRVTGSALQAAAVGGLLSRLLTGGLSLVGGRLVGGLSVQLIGGLLSVGGLLVGGLLVGAHVVANCRPDFLKSAEFSVVFFVMDRLDQRYRGGDTRARPLF